MIQPFEALWFCETQPSFLFFVAWTLLHVLVYLLVEAYLGFLWYVPIGAFELWIGYTVAIWQFGPPPDEGI
jgi:hypothetical protein